MPPTEEAVDDEAQEKKLAKHDASNAADLERVTDFHEEQELSGGDLEIALKAITEKRHKEMQVSRLRRTTSTKSNTKELNLRNNSTQTPDVSMV